MTTHKLVSLADVKEFLPFRSGVTEYDAKLATIVEAVSKTIQSAIRRDLSYGVKTQYFDTIATASLTYDFSGTSEDGLAIRGKEIQLLLKGMNTLDDPAPQVFYDTTRVFGADTQIASSLVHLDQENDRLIVGVVTRQSKQSIKVVYTSGYAADVDGVLQDIPDDIKMAALQQTLHVWNRTNPDAVSGQHDRIQGNRYGVPLVTKGGLLPDVIALLLPYRRITMRG